VHGILIQLPLPPHVQIRKVLERISVDKDVDGFHLYNVGGLVTGHQVFPPCTPYGVQKLLEHENIELDGATCGGRREQHRRQPTAMMLMQQDATVSICHKKTRDLAQYTMWPTSWWSRPAYRAHHPQMVRTGAVVIDVGINRLPDGRIVGDVDFEGVRRRRRSSRRCRGVGPMTRAMLLHTRALAERGPGGAM
jgi:methylenetetrahydrofolate dehydrogenase (NADP+)/methenyltetrahydrofolate cyclohydrolase